MKGSVPFRFSTILIVIHIIFNMKGLVPFRFSTIFIVIHITTSFQKPHYYDKHSHTEYELGSISFNRSKFFMSKFFVISKLDNH